jgi:hypothetical protein
MANETTAPWQFDGGLGASFTGASKGSRFLGGVSGAAPAATSVIYQAGDYVIDVTGTIWICTTGGAPGTWVQIAGATEPVSGQLLRAPAVYAPGTPASPAVNSTTLAAFDSTHIQTGSFTAPASGSVIVSVTFSGTPGTTTEAVAFALAAHGTVTPVIGNVITSSTAVATNETPYALTFVVTGLTGGTAYNLDLLGACASSTFTINAAGQTSVTPTGTLGAPVTMIVQGV